MALFFFLSGFGLMESETKNHLNIWQFVKKRFWKIYKAVLIINTIEYLTILIWNYCTTGMWNNFDIMKIIGITSQDGVLWFIKDLFVCYAAFMLCTQVVRCRELFLCLSVVVVPIILCVFGEAFYHWQSVPLFFIGALISGRKEISAIISRHWLSWLLLVVCIGACVYLNKSTGSMMPIHFIFDYGMILGFVWFCSTFAVEVKHKSLLGMLSFSIYLVHNKIILGSLHFGHLVPVWLFLILTLYMGWLLQKHLDIKIRKPSWEKVAARIPKGM